ncbi:hypothetical protein M426DRAFT_268103 [Hypoxylon sp. CI-4A]|nr:hypothetical protein M426DRAFT_268103 [Hypoxylon sp. CI-4A]
MPSESEQAFIREVWGLQGASYFVVALRYYNRFTMLGWRSLAWDDAIMLIAVMVYTGESIMAYLVVARWKGLANNAMADDYRVKLDRNSNEWHLRVNGSKTHVVGLLLYMTLLWLLKACWLVYYARLTAGVNNMRRVIRWGTVIVAVSYVSCLLVAFLKCIPFDHQWQIDPSPGNNCMPAISGVQTIYVMVTNTLTDFYLMAIPLPVVWKSHLPWRKKLVLLVMFSGGFLEMTFGILRCVSILTKGDTDPAQSGYWSVRESFVSVVLTNMPMIYPMFRKYIDKTRIATKSKTTQGDSRGYRLSSLPSRADAAGRWQQSTAAENDTSWGSREHIVGNKGQNLASEGEDEHNDLQTNQSTSVSFANENRNQDPQGPGWAIGDNRIVVTKEFTVTEGSSHNPQNYNKVNF